MLVSVVLLKCFVSVVLELVWHAYRPELVHELRNIRPVEIRRGGASSIFVRGVWWGPKNVLGERVC